MRRIVIGLAGKIGSGKGEIGKYLEARYGAGVFEFSDFIEYILGYLGVPLERENMQRLGEFIRRDFGPDTLVDLMHRKIKKFDGDIVVVDGVRFPNEVEMVRSFGGIILGVEAPARVRFERVRWRAEKGEKEITWGAFEESQRAWTERHIEEILDVADYVIINDSTIEDLHARVDSVMKKVMCRAGIEESDQTGTPSGSC